MEQFLKQNPGWKLVVTFFSPSGYAIRQNYSKALYVCYLPPDKIGNARKFIQMLQPQLVFFVKYDLWRNYLRTLHELEVPTYLISAIFRPEQLFFKSYGGWYRKWLHYFTRILVQNEYSAELLKTIDVHRVTVAGDTRFDRVVDAAKSSVEYPPVRHLAERAKIFIAGSTWPADQAPLLQVALELPEDWIFVLVPHEVDNARINRWIKLLPYPSARVSQNPMPEQLKQVKVLVVDTVGHLLAAYSSASLAYVGGGFGAGIHNTLEPAIFGIPVVFGPNYERFQEAKELLATGAAASVEAPNKLAELILKIMKDDALRESMGSKAALYVRENTGATQRILSYVEANVSSFKNQ